MMEIWKSRAPLKVKIFLWMVAHDRIQSACQLKKEKKIKEGFTASYMEKRKLQAIFFSPAQLQFLPICFL
jgi:hypothetical protein